MKEALDVIVNVIWEKRRMLQVLGILFIIYTVYSLLSGGVYIEPAPSVDYPFTEFEEPTYEGPDFDPRGTYHDDSSCAGECVPVYEQEPPSIVEEIVDEIVGEED